jgi:hypothetical protein
VPTRARLTETALKALKIQFSCDEGCLVGATLRVGATTIAGRTTSLGAAGAAGLRLAVSAAQRRAIARLRRSAKARHGVLTLTFTDGSGNRRKLTRAISLRH